MTRIREEEDSQYRYCAVIVIIITAPGQQYEPFKCQGKSTPEISETLTQYIILI